VTNNESILTNILILMLREASDGAFLIVNLAGNDNLYVQFLACSVDPDFITMEAVSNEFLPRHAQLTLTKQATLTEFGFSAPGTNSSDSPNYLKGFDIPAASESAVRGVVQLALEILKSVYGWDGATPLEITYEMTP
jgi:hypothetical protein